RRNGSAAADKGPLGGAWSRALLGPALVLPHYQRGDAVRTASLSRGDSRRRDGETHDQSRQAQRGRFSRRTIGGRCLLVCESSARLIPAARQARRGNVAADSIGERRIAVGPVDRA